MKKLWKRFLAVSLLLVILVLPVLALEPGSAVVVADWLNFRDKPDMSGKVLGMAQEGSSVEILEVLGDWCRVSWNGKEGYMSSRYLKQPEPTATPVPEATPTPIATPTPEVTPAPSATPAPEATPEPSAAPTSEATPVPSESPVPETTANESHSVTTGILTGDGVRFRAAGNLQADVYGYLYCGDKVTVLASEGDWYKVEYDGRIGYLYGQYVRIIENNKTEAESEIASASAEAVIALAKANLGVPYVYGGTTSSGFDCSGLTYYCFVNNGYTMNRTASQQYKQGSYVEKEALEPGDLVFFASPGSWTIGHVGLYIGDGKFIHASSGSAKVITSELDSWYYSTYYYGARRILN